jgi:hypothetical protein
VDHYSPDAHNVRSLFDSLERIEQKSLSKTFSLFAYINRKASEKHDSDRMIRQTLGDSLRTFMLMNRSRRESVITHDAVLSTGYVGFCGVRLLVWPGELLQPGGERWISAIERRQNMVAPEFLNEELRLRAHVRRSATWDSENNFLRRGFSRGG